MKRMIRRRRRTVTMPEVSLTPLIDTALTLLIIFMVTAPILQNNAIKVNLPKGKAQEAQDEQQYVVVAIDESQQVFVNGDKVSFDTLTDVVKNKVASVGTKTVFVKADTAINYGKVIEAVDQLKFVQGVEHVALATNRVASSA